MAIMLAQNQLPPQSLAGPGQLPGQIQGQSQTPAPAPVKVDAQWSCKVSAMDDRGQPAGEMKEGATVGTKFLLSCEGSAIALAKDHLSLELPKEAKYTLRLLETRSLSDERGEFVATSWAAGEFKLVNPVLTDGAKRVGLGKIDLKFATVIDPKQNPESKPFPPVGPMMMRWPAVVWISAVFVVLIIVLAVWSRVRRSLRRRQLLRLLESHPIAQKPYDHFNKELRRLSRALPVNQSDWALDQANGFLRELDEALRWFLARELLVLTLDRSPSDIVRDLKRSDEKLYATVRREVVIALQEVRKAKGAMSGNKIISLGDAHQIVELARAAADSVRKALAGKGA